MKDLIVGAITGYDFNKIEPWVNSVVRSGFTGDKIMLCYNVRYDVCNELVQRGFNVIGFERDDVNSTLRYSQPDFNVVVERFKHLAHVLRDKEYRYIISTDVKDVLFQRNPSEWLEKNIGDKKIIASSESIRYQHEDWGNHNIFRSFGPEIHSMYKDTIVSNAGVMAGDFKTMQDLFMHIKLLSDAAPSHYIEGGGGPDQAAYNILINSGPWKDVTRFTLSEDGWAAQLGTTGPQIQDRYGKFITEPLPTLNGSTVCTSTGAPFYIVHQYDRVPAWKDRIEKAYR